MSDVRTAYGTKVTLTTTNLTSLANNSAWQSATLDFDTAKMLDAVLRVVTKGQASGTGVIELYFAPSIAADTTYPDGATGTEGSFTAADRRNAILWDTVQLNAATSAVQKTLRSLVSLLGSMPRKGVLLIINKSGAALSATAGDTVIELEPVFATVV